MAHDHAHHHHHDHGSSNIGVAFFLNLSFTLLEVAGGLWTNSIAILSDALHDFGDSITLGIAWYLHKVSGRQRNDEYNYGYRRFSVLGAFITGLILLVGGVGVVASAVGRLIDPQPVYAPGMILMSIVGIAFNGAAVLKIKSGTSLNEQAVSWHLIEDVLGWVAVLIGSIVMSLWDVPMLDPLMSIGISIFVLWNVGKNLSRVFSVFMQRSPKSFDATDFSRQVREALPRVRSVHNTQTWTLDGEHHVLSAHLVLDPRSTREEIVATKTQVHRLLAAHRFEHITLDVELEGDPCAAHEAHAH
ncbi:MAG TPA: cation diffusion facilitator family transporter [Bdellovibrionota bacterium]|jgi:cobalt-zinc-cadmium efflux system protein|nr:cation diffusion facilitator family transporter [Bdellovibrionota bacterium]